MQAAWARQLQAALQRAGGCIERRAEAYAAAKAMVATLGDRYTEFLTPSQACLSGVCGCRIPSWRPRWATATPSSSRPRRHAFQGFVVVGFRHGGHAGRPLHPVPHALEGMPFRGFWL